MGLSELIVVLMILLLVFGASRLPQIGEGLGRMAGSFKRGMSRNDDIEVRRERGSAGNASQPAPKASGKAGGSDSERRREAPARDRVTSDVSDAELSERED